MPTALLAYSDLAHMNATPLRVHSSLISHEVFAYRPSHYRGHALPAGAHAIRSGPTRHAQAPCRGSPLYPGTAPHPSSLPCDLAPPALSSNARAWSVPAPAGAAGAASTGDVWPGDAGGWREAGGRTTRVAVGTTAYVEQRNGFNGHHQP